ncbi:MAG: hypothetical protein HGA51_04795 [Demequinaceae bacterium]|nr:hypothetical protein [Demequinaceae bacterium]
MTLTRFARGPAATHLLARLPEMLVAGTVALALAAGATVTLGVHRPWTTLPLALLIGVALWRAVRPRGAVDEADVRAASWSLAGVAAWIVVGIIFASEYLVVTRDPGFLALTGVWLTNHPTTDIPTLGAIEAAAQQPNVIPDAWQAWNLSGSVVQPQGAKMLPGVLSVGGWVDGVTGVLATNVVIGGIGILAVYLVARRLMGPLAALGPAALLALTVSHIGLSRSPYSEPLTLLLIVASIAWAWRGLEEGRIGALVAAGATSGATALCRIDGGVYALGVLLGVAAVCAWRGKRGVTSLLAFVLPQALMVGAGYWSLWRWSTSYIERLGSEARTLGLTYAGVVVLVVAFQLAIAPFLGRLKAAVATRRIVAGKAGAALAATTMIVLASRPLWMTDRRGTESTTDKFTSTVVGQFQQAEGYTVDPTRTYAEHTLNWLSYYLTWPILALATVGLAVIVWRAFTSRPIAVVFLGALAVPSAVYLVRPAIVPDQLWAIRRFEPITLPGLAIAAGVGAWWLAGWAARRFAAPHERVHVKRVGSIVAAVVMIVAPLTTYVSVRIGDEYPVSSPPYIYLKEQRGARAEIDELCRIIDGRPVILSGSSGYFGTIRVMCDVPVVLALVPLEADALAGMVEVWGREPVVVTRDPDTVWSTEPAPVLTTELRSGEYGLQHIPRLGRRSVSTWYAGTVGQDGTVSPIAPRD